MQISNEKYVSHAIGLKANQEVVSPGPDWDLNFFRAHTIEKGGASSRRRHKANVKYLGAHRSGAWSLWSALWLVRA
jgi:hypothetical protein